MISNFYKIFLDFLEISDYLWGFTEEWHKKHKQLPSWESILSIESTECDAFFKKQALQPRLHNFRLTFLDDNFCLSNFFHLRVHLYILLDTTHPVPLKSVVK